METHRRSVSPHGRDVGGESLISQHNFANSILEVQACFRGSPLIKINAMTREGRLMIEEQRLHLAED